MATSQAVIAALVVSAVTWNQPAPRILGAGTGSGTGAGTGLASRPDGVDAVIVGSAPSDWDPARQSD